MRAKAKEQKEAKEKQNLPPPVEVKVEQKPPLTKEEIAKRDEARKKAREHYHKNRDERILQNKKYKQDNKDKINATRRESLKKKMAENPVERMKRSMKTLLLAKIKKSNPSTTYFGTNMAIIKRWLEFNFDGDLTWDNYGTKWHIDHTIAIKKFDLSNDNEVKLCFNWKNLLPLRKDLNLAKATHLKPYSVFHLERQLRNFIKQENIQEDIEEYMHNYSIKFNSLLPEFFMQHNQIAGNP